MTRRNAALPSRTAAAEIPPCGRGSAGGAANTGRRGLWVPILGLTLGLALAVLAPVAPARASPWHNIDIAGSVPRLAFHLTDATTGKMVTAADFRGKIVLLYLGYTHCPDVCPLTLHNIAVILHRLGPRAADVRVLFVSVDPNRDTLPVLRDYVGLFGPDFVGLRPDADALARLARRYRLAYSVTPKTATHAYEVTHSAAVFVFDRNGDARLLVPSLAQAHPDLSGTTDDLERLLDAPRIGWLSRLRQLF